MPTGAPGLATSPSGAVAGPGAGLVAGAGTGAVGRRRLLVGLGGVVVAGGLAAAGWELTQPGPPRKTTTATSSSGGRAAWVQATGGPVRSAPVLTTDGTTVYLGSDDGSVYGYNAVSGKPAVKFPVGGAVTGIAVSGPTVVAGTTDGKVIAYDTDAGTVSWTYTAAKAIVGAPVLSPGVVLAGSADGYLHALEIGSGRRRWRTATGGAAVPATLGGDTYEEAWAGSQNGSLYVLNLSNGKAYIPPIPTGGAITTAPVVVGVTVYAGSGNGRVNSLGYDNQTKITPLSRYWQFTADGPVAGSPGHDNSAIYVATTAGTVYALAETSSGTGEELSACRLGHPVHSGPAAHNGLVYVGCDDGFLYSLDLSSPKGSVHWRYQTGGPVRSQPVTGNGLVYFGSLDHKVYALHGA